MKRIIHLADVHFHKDAQDLALASLECALEAGAREQIDAWVFAGDLFDRGVANSAASGFPRMVNVIQRMLDVAPIVSIEGTATHDVAGSYAVLCELKAKHRFINLRPESPEEVAGILFMGLPEAGKEWVLAGAGSMSAEESTKRLTEGIRSILLGFGATRAAQPELPAVLVMHGSVKGSALQNRTILDDGIGRDDLSLAGADYAALGHIHLEQKIDGLEAYYPGPAYHTDWGHLGKCGCNLVEIADEGYGTYYPVKITRIPFPHPRRVKFSLTFPEPVGPEIEGVQAWVCYRATKEEAQKIDTEAILETYLEAGALPGSRVTVELIPTETVRAAEITEKHTLREKVLVLAEAQATEKTSFIPELSASVLDKADLLEREAAEQGATAGMHFRLRRLRLRGVVGIWKGLRQDDIDVDLDKYDPGLIALIGVNGAGKSTLIENMHPYPCMLTRDGKLQDHFRLRDSARELWFVDERSGTEYRALMEIDGANASGSVKYHLFRTDETKKPGDLWTGWIPLTNGRKEDYEQAIEGLIGSLPLFLRSAFVSQRATKSNPDLSDATKGERKAIFRELAGLDYLQAYAESAKLRAGAMETKLTTGRGQVTLLEGIVAEEPQIIGRIDWSKAELQNADEKIEQLTTRGKELREHVEALHALKVEQEQIERDAGEAESASTAKRGQAGQAQEQIEDFQKALTQRELAQKVVDDHAALKEQEGGENERLSKINAERARLSAEYGNALKTHADAVRGLDAARTRLRTEKARLEQDHAVARSQYEALRVEVERPLTDECPTCGALREHQVKDLNAGREEKQELFRALGEKIHALENQVMCKEAEIIEVKDPPAPTPPPLPPVDDTELKRIRGALAAINLPAAQAVLSAAAQAEAKIAELEARIETLEKEAVDLATKAEQLRAKLFPETAEKYSEAQEQYERARQDFIAAKETRATAAAKLEAAQKQLAEIGKQRATLDELRTSLASMEAEAAEWRYLEQACGPDGIQALELDALGPGIAETANRILNAAYGNRFALEFRTTRIGGKGSKAHQIEDFLIWIVDSELGTEQEISTLSGGESVWIKNALWAAFGIIRERSTGIKFLTCFLDEMDGALDPEARQKYFDMLQAIHQESGRRHTLIITHSESAQEMIPQRIIMKRDQA